MVKLTHAELRVLDEALYMGSGYLLDFSDRTMSEFFDDAGSHHPQSLGNREQPALGLGHDLPR
jgi:hypothetical protein